MEIDVRPEPDEDARRAIEAALAALREADDAGAGGSAWWRAGVEDAVREDFSTD